ncbi:MAG: exosortase system-associated protein, TIGR04073 family [Chthoniobacteraceae bacterium]|nr:exosortase system-associated protein, TIGR04073 family [Chthoniobacteraceae bacterium]
MKSFPKILVAAVSLAAFGTAAFADIQAPPMTDMGPTRKLGRGVANVLWGFTELPHTMCVINESEGNSAAFGYGIVKGMGRSLFRFGAGWYEIFTFAAPCYKSSYRPPYNAYTPWKLGTYDEFPPELGWESRYDY